MTAPSERYRECDNFPAQPSCPILPQQRRAQRNFNLGQRPEGLDLVIHELKLIKETYPT